MAYILLLTWLLVSRLMTATRHHSLVTMLCLIDVQGPYTAPDTEIMYTQKLMTTSQQIFSSLCHCTKPLVFLLRKGPNVTATCQMYITVQLFSWFHDISTHPQVCSDQVPLTATCWYRIAYFQSLALTMERSCREACLFQGQLFEAHLHLSSSNQNHCSLIAIAAHEYMKLSHLHQSCQR